MYTFERKSKDNKSQKVFLSEQMGSILKFGTPSKLKDPGVPTILCFFGNHKIAGALLNLGSSVNLIPYSVYLKLELGEFKPSNCTLQLADGLVKNPRGRINNVLIQINKGLFLLTLLYWMEPNHVFKQLF